MRQTILAGVMVAALGLAAPVWAKPPAGKGHGHAPESSGEHAKKAAGRVADETVDAVTDEMVGTQSSSGSKGMPPGLAKKDKMPPGLAKQHKTPPGWEKGRKEGWNGHEPEKKEGLIRRTIRGIFHRPPKPAQ